jgi:hypothetical protein
MKCKPRLLLALLALTQLALSLAGCPETPDMAQAPGPAAQPVKASAPGPGYDFTPQQVSNIIGNKLHDAHTVGAKLECQACHSSAEWLTPQAAVVKCKECHAAQVIATGVWNNHCICCHQFTKFTESYAESNTALNKLCEECHGPGKVVYASFDAASPHDITCTNCHSPHQSALIHAQETCAECHADVVDKTSPDNKVHGSCIVCHSPHTPLPDSTKLCGECHYADSTILVHNVPEHPTDCLACHSPHFTSAEVTGLSCVACHAELNFDKAPADMPGPHADCHTCHLTSSFEFIGDSACAKCHAHEGEVVSNPKLPPPHQDCRTCHQPHTWIARFEGNCTQCHDISKVIEHNLSFHQHDCRACHDPHQTSTMAPSGQCHGCHVGRFPDFAADLPEPHYQCRNCHSQVEIDSRRFKFAGPAASCLNCHTQSNPATGRDWQDIPKGHLQCNACHSAHMFKIAPDIRQCDRCHRGLFESAPRQEHGECFNCHAQGHAAYFLGPEASCDTCHPAQAATGAAANYVKQDCVICHPAHNFTSEAGKCQDCHAKELANLGAQDSSACAECHAGHTWKPQGKEARCQGK